MTGGFFALFDDIATLLDDAAAMSKVATKKTVSILGDDLAVSAKEASGFASSRELPVLWAITKGSLKNKFIILPFAFLLSAFLPWSIKYILMLGAIYLSFEGAEKIYEYLFHKHKEKKQKLQKLSKEEILKIEKKKIKSAIMTDFVLSVEIVIMALGTVLEQTLPIQIIAVSVVAILATVGVYGSVALIVRMDDFGLRLVEISDDENSFGYKIGKILINALPKVIRALSVIGTIAMLLVAGGIFMHNVEELHHIFHAFPTLVAEMIIGLCIGFVALAIEMLIGKMLPNVKSK
jgi:predicted DNA repair protein MutK